MRGEYRFAYVHYEWFVELPPRARRIPPSPHIKADAGGTTSACAENTCGQTPWAHPPRNYLRVRGEYSFTGAASSLKVELPPRARRILLRRRMKTIPIGTTSACAENTRKLFAQGHGCRNYLRVRGEYDGYDYGEDDDLELPPRARRIPPATIEGLIRKGTTSACAENTHLRDCGRYDPGNYLRVRGEYGIFRSDKYRPLELPPRARRIQ